MSESMRLPRAWRGREPLMSLVLRARVATRTGDSHAERMSALLVSCFGGRTFPSEDEFRDAVGEMSDAIKRQVFAGGPVPDDPEERLGGIAALLGAAVAERARLP